MAIKLNENTLKSMVMEAVQKLLEDEAGEIIEQIPDWAMCYLFYGDESGLDEEEKQMADQWERQMIESGFDLGLMEPVSWEPHFSYYPAFGKGCNVYDVAIREKSM